jgi:hypothetical protein
MAHPWHIRLRSGPFAGVRYRVSRSRRRLATLRPCRHRRLPGPGCPPVPASRPGRDRLSRAVLASCVSQNPGAVGRNERAAFSPFSRAAPRSDPPARDLRAGAPLGWWESPRTRCRRPRAPIATRHRKGEPRWPPRACESSDAPGPSRRPAGGVPHQFTQPGLPGSGLPATISFTSPKLSLNRHRQEPSRGQPTRPPLPTGTASPSDTSPVHV